jgi:hypothetical protein
MLKLTTYDEIIRYEAGPDVLSIALAVFLTFQLVYRWNLEQVTRFPKGA